MPQHKIHKKEQRVQLKQAALGIDFTNVLPAAVMQSELSGHLPNPDVLSIYQTSKKLRNFFQPKMDVLSALTCVVQGNLEALTPFIQKNPGLLFKKGVIKAPRGQTYYNVSPYMLMSFLCDEDMIKNIMPFIPNAYQHVRQDQYAELGYGGSDLVKLDFDPMSVTDDDFYNLIEFKTHIDVWGTPTDITFPLLENPDGLLYWKDNQGEVRFYYVNRETKTVLPLVPVAATPEEQQALEAFKESFDEMESNSARRSTNKEHQLIAKIMQRALHRQGIRYSNADGEQYCDSRTPFQLINHYRTVIRLYAEAVQNNQWEKAHHYWRKHVGTAQGEEMWLLQRICEEKRPFYPLPSNFKAFKRGFLFIDLLTNHVDEVFKEGRLSDSLGSDFTLYKGPMAQTAGAVQGHNEEFAWSPTDLESVCRLVEEAKAKINEREPESDPLLQSSNSPQY